jgi:hypothetical protein
LLQRVSIYGAQKQQSRKQRIKSPSSHRTGLAHPARPHTV